MTWDAKDVHRQPDAAQGPGRWAPRPLPAVGLGDDDAPDEAADVAPLEEDPVASPVFFALVQDALPGRAPLFPLAVRREMAQLGMVDEAGWERRRKVYTRGIPAL